MPQLPYNCSIDALVDLSLLDKAQRDRLEREERERIEELRKTRDLSLNNILKDVCTVFKQNVESVKSSSREGELVLCRTIHSYIAREKTHYTLRLIGLSIGGRDHTTIIHNARKVRGYLKVQDPSFMVKWRYYLDNSTLFTTEDFN